VSLGNSYPSASQGCPVLADISNVMEWLAKRSNHRDMGVPVFSHLSHFLSTDDEAGIPKREYVDVNSDQNDQVFEGQEMWQEVLQEDLSPPVVSEVAVWLGLWHDNWLGFGDRQHDVV
jgi:hypothetical protein